MRMEELEKRIELLRKAYDYVDVEAKKAQERLEYLDLTRDILSSQLLDANYKNVKLQGELNKMIEEREKIGEKE